MSERGQVVEAVNKLIATTCWWLLVVDNLELLSIEAACYFVVGWITEEQQEAFFTTRSSCFLFFRGALFTVPIGST